MTHSERLLTFAHFLFSKVKSGNVIFQLETINGETGCLESGKLSFPAESCKLVLKPLKSVTRADAKRVAELAGIPAALYKTYELRRSCFDDIVFGDPEKTENYRNRIVFKEECLNFQQVDYLRGKGYAIGLPADMFIIDTDIISS